jgi:hypothetical protein
MSWIWPAFAGFVASTAALIGSGAILILGDKAERAADWLLSFAIGTPLAGPLARRRQTDERKDLP